ncbi:MAG: Hpt domain-containing protein [Pseudomonadota bacterium]
MATLADPAFQARLAALNAKFGASIAATLASMQAERALCGNALPAASGMQQLHVILHTVAGSAATFGFPVFGQQARRLDNALRLMLEQRPIPAQQWAAWLAEFDVFLAWVAADPQAATYP